MGTDAKISDQQPTQAEPTPTKEGRGLWWGLVGLSIIMTLVSGATLAKRIAQYNENQDYPLFAYVQVASPKFTYAGRPIEFVEETIDDRDVVIVRYGEQELVLDVTIPPLVPLPTLFERHKDWLTVAFFADRSDMSMAEFQQGVQTDEIRPRLAIVTRTPFGVEPLKDPNHPNLQQEENWGTGEIRRDLWRFDCYELLRDGTIVHEEKRFPESGKSLLRRQNYAKLKGEPIPQRGEGELEEYSWEYGAALKIMPRAPAITMERQALRDSGWTLPMTAAGFLLFFVSFFFAIAPPRTTA